MPALRHAQTLSLTAATFLWCLVVNGARADAVHVTTVEGVRSSGKAVTIDENGKVQLVASPVTEFATADVLRIEWDRDPDRSATKLPALLMAGGQILHGTLKSAADETIIVNNPLTGEAAFPITSVEALLLATRLGPRAKEQLVQRLRNLTSSSDALLLINDDVLKGTITAFGPDEWSIDREGSVQTVKSDALRGAALDPSLVEEKAPSGAWSLIELVDGSAIRATRIASGDSGWQVKTTSGPELTVRLDAITSLNFFGGRASFISDLPFTHSEQYPFLDKPSEPSRDTSAEQAFLSLGNKRIRKGIQVRPFSKIEVDASGFERFLATIGIDDSAGNEASVVFRVLLDGKQVFESPEMTRTHAPVEVNLETAGAKTVTLVTDYGRRADADDLANWGEARLVRASSP